MVTPLPLINLVRYLFDRARKFIKRRSPRTIKQMFMTSLGTVAALLVSCGDSSGGGGAGSGGRGRVYSPLSCIADWNCPTGFIPVCGNPVLGTSDFCVMKFEAKNANSVATSQAAGTPWARTSGQAYSSCNSLTESSFDGDFALISNREWMTVARAIEAVASNWSGGVVGSGHLARGHSDGFPASYLAVTDEDDPWDGTGQDGTEEAGSGQEQRRTHTLPSGDVVWDFAGNRPEWVDWDDTDAAYTSGPTAGLTEGTKEFSAPLEGELTTNDVRPRGSYTSDQSVGAWIYSSGGQGAVRGIHGLGAVGESGIFMLHLGIERGDSYGLRCVYLP